MTRQYVTAPIKVALFHRYLGVLIDQDLSFTQHIDKISTEAWKRFGLICNIYKYNPHFNHRILVYLYKAYIRPLLEYCSPIFLLDSVSPRDIAKLEKLQHTILSRFIVSASLML